MSVIDFRAMKLDARGVRIVALAAIAAALTAMLVEPIERGEASSRWRQEVPSGVKRVMRHNPIPGAIVGVWRAGRKPYVRAFGVRSRASRRKMRPDLHIRIGSETKTFTATALLQQVDRGKVGLDDPISKYVEGVPNGAGITIRQLLEMRSGLVSYSAVDAWANLFLANPRQPWEPTQLLQYGYSQPPLFAPGTDYNYSNSNYVLLGLVVERVTGRDLSDYIRREILRPARMRQSLLPVGAKFPSPHADGYTRQTPTGRVARSTNWNPSWAWAAGGLISTLGDLHRWARVAATGKLLSRATQRQRTQFIQIPTIPSAAYGLGLVNIDGWIGHNGSLPGYESVTVYLPAKRMTMVVLINSDISPPQAELSSLVGAAITKVISPAHIYELDAVSLRPVPPAG
jgi:D-alanyl-D-alanine carboxypeptidase